MAERDNNIASFISLALKDLIDEDTDDEMVSRKRSRKRATNTTFLAATLIGTQAILYVFVICLV
ncbi:hypothetical protein DPMN_051954 [Dreissena polymorpha]|uniref:Uncharacterized protein n=1 Tax=Dreissena polymorpha TaxID=45954 RepID=A0A9D4CKI1_DREPO|nr:hypothetical protein DPMN_051954 [Dreissena polymorpha]